MIEIKSKNLKVLKSITSIPKSHHRIITFKKSPQITHQSLQRSILTINKSINPQNRHRPWKFQQPRLKNKSSNLIWLFHHFLVTISFHVILKRDYCIQHIDVANITKYGIQVLFPDHLFLRQSVLAQWRWNRLVAIHTNESVNSIDVILSSEMFIQMLRILGKFAATGETFETLAFRCQESAVELDVFQDFWVLVEDICRTRCQEF